LFLEKKDLKVDLGVEALLLPSDLAGGVTLSAAAVC